MGELSPEDHLQLVGEKRCQQKVVRGPRKKKGGDGDTEKHGEKHVQKKKSPDWVGGGGKRPSTNGGKKPEEN